MRRVLLVAMVVVPLCVSAQDGSDACLITRDEFAAASGWTAYSDPEPMPWGSGAVCGYDGGQIFLFSGDAAMESLETIWKRFGAAGDRVPVPELGADAYAFFMEAEDAYQDHGTFVVFTTGPHAVSVTVYAQQGEPADSALPQAIAVANMIGARPQ